MCYYFEIEPVLVNFYLFSAILLVKITNICGQSPGDQRTQHYVVLVYPNICPWVYIRMGVYLDYFLHYQMGGRIFGWAYIRMDLYSDEYGTLKT